MSLEKPAKKILKYILIEPHHPPPIKLQNLLFNQDKLHLIGGIGSDYMAIYFGISLQLNANGDLINLWWVIL